MGGGMNNWMNNPFAYLMFLALFRNGGFGFGGDGAGTATQDIETQAQLNAIRTQLQDNQNADCIKSAIQGNGFALSQLAQTLNIDFNTLQKCCCDVQAAIQQVAGQDNTQRIIDTLNNHWKDEQALKIQDLKFELSQERQNNHSSSCTSSLIEIEGTQGKFLYFSGAPSFLLTIQKISYMLLFKDIKQNYPVYILDIQEFSLIQGKATQVSFPRLEMNQKTGKTEMVVDITIEANGKMATYAIPESHSVTYAGHLVLSTEKSGLTSEVEAQKANAEQVLASASKAQNIIDKAPSLLAELNPMYKEKQETEQRFGKIEGSIGEMKELMKKQQEMMENFIKKFES